MYNHFNVLRAETTINDPIGFRVYRTKENDPEGKKDWRVLRRSVADLHRRAQVSASTNERYLTALTDAKETKTVKELIAKANELPIMIDLSHCGDRTRAEATALSRAPVCTHSNSAGLRPNGRNTEDTTTLALAVKGGVIGVCGLPQSLSDHTPTLDDFLDHVDHLVKLVGIERVGLGVDYVEAYQDQTTVEAPPSVVMWRTRRPDIFGPLSAFGRQTYPIGIESVIKLPNLTQGLIDRGYRSADIAAILGGNWLRAFHKFCG